MLDMTFINGKKKRNISVLRQHGVEYEGSQVKMKQTTLRLFPALTCCSRLFQIPLPPPILLTLTVRPSTSDTVADCILTLEEWGGGGGTHAH